MQTRRTLTAALAEERPSEPMPTIAARLPESIVSQLDRLASEAGVTRSAAIRAALRAALGDSDVDA